MALGSPYNIGSTAAAAGVSTTVVTVGTDANSDGTTVPSAGHSVFVLIGISSGASTVSTVTDSKSNAYTLSPQGHLTPPNSQSCYVYECLNPGTHLAAADTVTVTWLAATAATSNVRVIGCSGVASSSADDQSGSNSGSGTSVSITAGGSLAQASELAIAITQSGSGTGGVLSWGTFTQMGHNLRSGTGSYFGVATLDTASTAAPSASATLGTSGSWGVLLLTFKASTGGAGGLSIVNTSPLPGGQVGVAYSDQLTASGGITPYTWAVTSGSLPAGVTLEPGGGSGASGDFGFVGVNTGPQGAPTVGQFNSSYSTLGPIGCYKVFYSAGGSGIYTGYLGGDVNGGSNAFANGLEGQIVTAQPGTFIYVSWGVKMSAAAINQYCSQIPHTVAAVGFTYQSEPEGAYSIGSGAQFVADWNDQAQKIHAAQANTPVQLVTITSHYEQHYQDGTLSNGSFIPPAQFVDVYGFDFYDRQKYWVGSDMSTNKAWVVWTGLVKGQGKPLALTEFGISGATSDAQQNTRLQADIVYLKAAFGPGGSLSTSPLYLALYWNTGGTSFSTGAGSSIDQMLGTGTQKTWAGLAATQAGTSSTGTGGGGLLAGTPTAAAVSTPTIRVTDAASTTSSTAFSLTVTAAGTLAILTTTPLPGGTIGTAYATLLTASGGTPPYTWSLNSGALPTGLAISGQQVTGTPTGSPGTASFVLKVTDNVAATATLSATLVTSSGLTVTTTSLPAGTAGAAYTGTLAATGGTTPYTWSVATGTLPDGLTLDPVLGVITGTPTTPVSAVLTFTVTDSAGATGAVATSAQITLAVSLGSGGLPALPRFVFGGGQSDFGFQFSGTAMIKSPTIAYSFWTTKAPSTGSQHTDLTDMSNVAIASGLVTSDSSGFLGEFHAPPGVLEMYADASGSPGTGPRYRLTAQNLSSSYIVLYNAVKGVTG